ncbi:MAG: chemotaxis protein CheW [Oscillochloridaceae bacterium umkhey_bin13]
MELRQLVEDPEAWSILVERARALALQEDSVVGELGAATLTFRLGDSSYSLPAIAVREVQPMGRFATLPAVPPFVLGLVNVRGRLITALDLRPLLGLPAAPLAPGAMLLIVSVDDNELGIAADSVLAVRSQRTDLAPAPSAASGRSVAWVRGVDEELSIHLDPVMLFADPTLVVNAEAEGA